MGWWSACMRFVSQRRVMAAMGLVVLAWLVWIAGPMLSFADRIPLEETAVRGGVVLLLLYMALALVKQWSWQPGAMLALSLCVWFALPHLRMGLFTPAAPVWVRVLLLCLLWGLFWWYRRPPGLAGFRRGALATGAAVSCHAGDAQLQQRLGVLERGFAAARRHVAAQRALVSWRRRFCDWLLGREVCPRYVMLGLRHSGKSSMLAGAGFGLVDDSNRDAQEKAGGCTWWTSPDGVLIETPGRYMIQSRHQGEHTVDAVEWHAFLACLQQAPKAVPVNGILLTMRVQDLLVHDVCRGIAAGYAQRIREMQQVLGIRCPVFLMITHADQLPGFPAYFQSLDDTARRQPWGFAVGTLPAGSDALVQACREGFRQLAMRVDKGVVSRMDAEYDHATRQSLYVLPEEFRRLGACLEEVAGILATGTVRQEDTGHISLRGVYFSSTIQDGKRCEPDPAALFTAVTGQQSCMHPDIAGVPLYGSRHYFLGEVMQGIVLASASVAQMTVRRRRRRALAWTASQVVALCLLAWLASALGQSYRSNDAYLEVVSGQLALLQKKASAYRQDPQMAQLPGMMRALQVLPDGAGMEMDARGLEVHYGLYMPPVVERDVDKTYLVLYRRLFLPQLRTRVTLALEKALSQKDPEMVYDTLRVYLMLFEPALFAQEDMRDWIVAHWHTYAPHEADAALAGVHLDRLTRDASWYRPMTGRDQALVQRARSLVAQQSSSARVYQMLRRALLRDSDGRLTLEKMAGSEGARVLTVADTRMQQGIPWLFTRDGYVHGFRSRLHDVMASLRHKDALVIGKDARWQEDMAHALQRDYLEEYAQWWGSFLASVQPVAVRSSPSLVMQAQVARTLGADDSPLARLVTEAAANTHLAQAGSYQAILRTLATWLPSSLRPAGAVADKAAVPPAQQMTHALVDARFALLHKVAGSADSKEDKKGRTAAPSLADVLALISEQADGLQVASGALATARVPEDNDLQQRMQAMALQLPAPLQQVLAGVSGQAGSAVTQAIGGLLARQVEESVSRVCRTMTEGHYPFADAVQEISADDFVRLFGEQGVIDAFFRERMAAHVDTSRHPWTYQGGAEIAGAPDLRMFEQAARIRDVFLAGGASVPTWAITVRVPEMDPGITQMVLDVDGHAMRYAHGPVVPERLTWPGPRGGGTASVSVLPRAHDGAGSLVATGPWALLRLLDQAQQIRPADSSRMFATFAFEARQVMLEIDTGQMSPWHVLRTFRCGAAVLPAAGSSQAVPAHMSLS